MINSLDQIARLSPDKRKLLLMRLRKQGADFNAFPLSYAQQRLWFFDRLEPGNSLYNIPMALRLSGSLDVAALQKTLSEVVKRHDTLRARILNIEGQAMQVISPATPVPLPVVDMLDLPGVGREKELQRLVSEEAQRPFDLAQGPLMRVVVLRVGEADHAVLFTMHHIAGDGWSVGVLIKEVAAIYEAITGNGSAALPDLPIQYTDFAAWQRQWLQGEALQQQLAYWKQQLDGKTEPLRLPTDRPRPPVQTFSGERYHFELAETLTGSLKALSQQNDATLFMTLLAAFQVLLHRYTGQRWINVSTPISGRTRLATEGLIGLFANTLVMNADFERAATFLEFLTQVRRVVLESYAHQDLPFEKLVEELQPKRDLSHGPLSQVMFILQNTRPEPMKLPGLKTTVLKTFSKTAKFDLTLHLTDAGGSIRGAFEFNTDLFDLPTVERMACHLKTLLRAIALNPNSRVSSLPLMTGAEKQELLIDFNNTSRERARGGLFTEMFEAQVDLHPDGVAVEYKRTRLTYAQLDRASNRLAHYLRRAGVGPETTVAVYVDRSPEMLVSLLAVLKAGGAYVPLDRAYPRERLAFMLKDCGARAVITKQNLLDGLPGHAARLVLLDGDREDIEAQGGERIASGVAADNLAYVIYTSGSTGKPKGVMIPHGGLANYLSWCTERYRVDEGVGAPVHSPVGFDLTITSLFSPLLAGRKVILLEEDSGVEALSKALSPDSNFSFVKITPSHLDLLSHLVPAENAAGCAKALIIGGEALKGESLAFWQANSPETRLINEYGPTEAVVGCIEYEVPRGARISGAVPIGRPIYNAEAYIIDSNFEPVPVGVPGELLLGGAGLARGYCNGPDLTAVKFVPDPFARHAGARLYRTGDLARHLPGGRIEFLGRIDSQVKVRGFRIELKEIESVILNHTSAGEAVVLAREGPRGDKRLVAYVVPPRGRAVSEGDLRNHLRRELPAFLIPSSFVILDKLPSTPNGKLDLDALLSLEAGRPELESEYVPPQEELEEAIASIWREVLGIDRVGRNDNFFDLGGHSLLLVEAHVRLAAAVNERLTLLDLFKYPTVESLADYLRAMGEGGAAAESHEERAKERREFMRKQRELRQKRRARAFRPEV